jgi:hypothetical protein
VDAVASCARRARGRMTLRWTAKSCGPDTPTLVSSLRMQVRRRRWQESPVAGESTKETVKTIARGMPGVSGVTYHYHCTRGYRAHRAPGIPCALCHQRDKSSAKPRTHGATRMRTYVYLQCLELNEITRAPQIDAAYWPRIAKALISRRTFPLPPVIRI